MNAAGATLAWFMSPRYKVQRASELQVKTKVVWYAPEVWVRETPLSGVVAWGGAAARHPPFLGDCQYQLVFTFMMTYVLYLDDG